MHNNSCNKGKKITFTSNKTIDIFCLILNDRFCNIPNYYWTLHILIRLQLRTVKRVHLLLINFKYKFCSVSDFML